MDHHYAHSVENESPEHRQRLDDHLSQVASLSRDFATAFGAERAAERAGLLHDLGKYTPAFQRYIRGERRTGGKGPDHSTAGAVEALARSRAVPESWMAWLVAHAIAGHHAGLADGADLAGPNGRLAKALEPLDPLWRQEIEPDDGALWPSGFRAHEDRARHGFQLSVLGRMIFSCLVDADYLDTEAFYASVAGWTPDRNFPELTTVIDTLRARFDGCMKAKMAAAERTPLNALRADILAHARGKAELPPGLFTLDVPTGGGKTLASLGFALDHARIHGLSRIIYAIPFTSVIDQTVGVFREVLGQETVLEHHSAIDAEQAPRDDDRFGKSKLRLAMETWAAPVVVTTNVQLFESLFAARPSRCRKLHNLARSVIVLDEAQTIPLHVLRPCVAMLDELARNYGATVVLCTATQPALGRPGFGGGLALEPERELAPDPPGLHRKLARVALHRAHEPMSDAQIVAELASVAQGLVIVNSRSHALALYREADAVGLDGLVHLTTRQTARDRQAILAEVRSRLDPSHPLPCRLIATSLVEAGVDIDFPRVWRADAGLDQIMQAAGRCNREGRRPKEESLVTVFRPAKARSPREIEGFAKALAAVAPKHDDLLGPTAIAAYFEEVYWRKGDALDRDRIVEAFRISATTPDLAFRSVAERFRLIEETMLPVIVARDAAARRTLEALEAGRLSPGAAARALQRHLVQVPQPDRNRLVSNGHAAFVPGFEKQFAVLTTEHFYTRETGLVWERADELGLETPVV
ncbi:CRISPR-associated endonuclease Cas3'' [Stappia sp. ICDLI1TA098]